MFNRSPRQADIELGGLHLYESFAVELLHRARPIFEMQIKSVRGLRDIAQPFFIQLRFHHLTLHIFDESRAACLARDRNERTFRCAYADRENMHAVVDRGFCSFHRVAAQFFAIGENNERAIAGCAFAEGVIGERDRCGNVGAAFRDRFGVQGVDRFDRGFVINRERRLQKGAPGKRDQPDAIALQLIDEVLRGEFDPGESARRDVV